VNDPRISEGRRITLEVFQRMKQFCAMKGIGLYVVMLPTKETVFSEYITRKDIDLTHQAAIHQLIEYESTLNKEIKQYFDEHRIAYIDVTESLKAAVGKQTIYPTNQDGHPNKTGYELIARTILANLSNE
jgi:hypothetical protein